jgi:predicted unusual protein kinase regulating ubiquinone biosynthesis (AarF/ABC1/UbiB family)
MAQLTRHATVRSAARSLMGSRITRHPERYMEILRILRKYDLQHIAVELGLVHRHELEANSPPPATARRNGHNGRDAHEERHARALAGALEELGPCFIKLGQLLSTRPDLLPAPYIAALSRLQDTITPVPGEEIAGIVESELGAPVSELFAEFSLEPLGTASMAQVHHAVLKDGSDVVVKVQKPGVRQRVEVDMEIMHEVARFAARHTPFGARYGLDQMVRELEQSLNQELDFRQEAENTRLISSQIADFTMLTTPEVFQQYTSRRVITLSYVHGKHLADLAPGDMKELNADDIAKDLLSAYLKQIVIDGIFHCDPHPGNIFITGDGRLALMDFGMVGRFDSGQKDSIIRLLLAFAERQGDRVADTYFDMVEIPRGFDRRGFTQEVRSLVSRYHDMSGGHMALGTALLDLTRLAQSYMMPVPSAMTLLGKTMLNLDGTISVLSPALDPVQLIRDYMLNVMEKRVSAQMSPGRTFAWLIDMKHLVENSPRRAEMILDKLANDQITVHLEVNELDETMKRFSHAANKLSLSMIVGSLAIGGGYVLGAVLRRDSRGR